MSVLVNIVLAMVAIAVIFSPAIFYIVTTKKKWADIAETFMSDDEFHDYILDRCCRGLPENSQIREELQSRKIVRNRIYSPCDELEFYEQKECHLEPEED